MDRLTRDDLVRWLQSALRANEHDWTCDADRDKESALLQAIFDLALSALSQEAVRDEGLEEAARRCEQMQKSWTGGGDWQGGCLECADAIRALKREPNAAAQGSATVPTIPLSGPAPAAPVAEIVRRLRDLEHEFLESMDCSGSAPDRMKSRGADRCREAADLELADLVENGRLRFYWVKRDGKARDVEEQIIAALRREPEPSEKAVAWLIIHHSGTGKAKRQEREVVLTPLTDDTYMDEGDEAWPLYMHPERPPSH